MFDNQNLRPDNVNFAIYLDPNLIVNSVSLFILCPELFDSLSILLVSESNKSHVSISIHPWLYLLLSYTDKI